MKKLSRLLLPVIILALVFSFAACGKGGEKAGDGPIDLKLGTYASTSFVGNFDPFGMWGNTVSGYGNCLMIYDSLYFIDSTGAWSSRIVDKAEWTDDLTYVVTLKDNILFSNGEKLVGEDVLYSLYIRQNSGKRSSTYMNFNVDRSTVSDDGLTITFAAESPDPAFYDGLDFSIVDKSYLESKGGGENIDWYDPAQVVGSGPYSVTDFVQDSSVTYTKRDDYWGEAYGYHDAVHSYTVTNYTDQTTMAIDLETGTLDAAIDLALNDYNRLNENTDSNVKTGIIAGNVCYQLVWDSNNNEYLKDPKIREALCCAIDTASLTEAVAGNYGTVADSMFAPGELGYVGGNSYEYDVERAKQLLEEAGIKDGELNLNIIILNFEPYTSMAQVIQGYLEKVGVGLNIEAYEMATFIASTTPGASDMTIYTMNGGNPSGEPTTHLDYWYSTGMNPVMRRDYDDLLTEAAGTLDHAKREQLYGQLQQLWHDNFDAVPLYEYKIGYAYNSDVFEDLTLASPNVVWLFDAVLK